MGSDSSRRRSGNKSTRAAKKPNETAPDQVGKKAQNGSENGAGSNGEDESAAAGQLVVSDADELIALGAPAKDTGVDATLSAANATEAQRAANAQVLQPNNNGVKQNAGDAALSRAKPVISAEGCGNRAMPLRTSPRERSRQRQPAEC